MATAKQEMLRMLDTLPDDASWEDLQESIYVRERIERALREVDEGKVIDQEEIEVRMRAWLGDE